MTLRRPERFVEGEDEMRTPTAESDPTSQSKRLAIAVVPSPGHALADHPETITRFDALGEPESMCPSAQWLEVEPIPANAQQLARVHPRVYLQALAEACRRGPAYIEPAPTYVTPGSYAAALQAAGSALAVVDQVMDGKASAGLALVRPPGHHATATISMGYCLLNNIALAARHAQAKGLRRILIVDVDVHHGNGTQEIFYEDPDVLYISTHEFGTYPGSGNMDEQGAGAGLGATINVPLPPHAGDESFLQFGELILEPAAHRFRPDVVLVSAGFDAHWRDPLASLQLTALGAYRLARGLRDLAATLCEGRLAFILEGGYDPRALAGCLAATACALAEAPAPPDPFGPPPYDESDSLSVLKRVAALHHL
jgi:acetoin utilization deacetylase AcuC-like enzyme